MRIRILDRILVALAGLILVAFCAGLVAQVFFGVDVAGSALCEWYEYTAPMNWDE